MLCEDRTEGFGPKSSISSPLPTSCFIDTVLIPLPIYIALFLLPILFLLSNRHRRQTYNPSTAHLRVKKRRNCLFTTASVIYYVLIVANILMEVLEIVRLELLKNYGISLIPFVFVGLMVAFGLHLTEGVGGRIRGWQAINSVLWVGGIVVNTIKVVGLVNEGIDGRKGTKYPIVDQVTDIAVMAGVYVVLAILEMILGFWRASRRSDARGSVASIASPVLESGWTSR